MAITISRAKIWRCKLLEQNICRWLKSSEPFLIIWNAYIYPWVCQLGQSSHCCMKLRSAEIIKVKWNKVNVNKEIRKCYLYSGVREQSNRWELTESVTMLDLLWRLKWAVLNKFKEKREIVFEEKKEIGIFVCLTFSFHILYIFQYTFSVDFVGPFSLDVASSMAI